MLLNLPFFISLMLGDHGGDGYLNVVVGRKDNDDYVLTNIGLGGEQGEKIFDASNNFVLKTLTNATALNTSGVALANLNRWCAQNISCKQ